MDLKTIAKSLIKNEGENKTEIEELVLYKLTQSYCKISAVVPPTICFIINGQKNIHLGEKEYIYNENTYLLGSANMPIESELQGASEDNPYIGFVVYINEKILSDLLVTISNDLQFSEKVVSFIDTAPITEKINDVLIRLLEICNDPLKVKLFGEPLLKELYFYVLLNNNGQLLYNCIKENKNSHKIVPIIHYLEKHFKEDINISDLSKLIDISDSSLHEHFKKATTLSPIQFLKKIRLDNAYKLLLSGVRSGEAAMESGYNSQAQFSREFKKVYGVSPKEVKLA